MLTLASSYRFRPAAHAHGFVHLDLRPRRLPQIAHQVQHPRLVRRRHHHHRLARFVGRQLRLHRHRLGSRLRYLGRRDGLGSRCGAVEPPGQADHHGRVGRRGRQQGPDRRGVRVRFQGSRLELDVLGGGPTRQGCFRFRGGSSLSFWRGAGSDFFVPSSGLDR